MPDLITRCDDRPENGEIQRNATNLEALGLTHQFGDHQLGDAVSRLRVASYKIERNSCTTPRDEGQYAHQVAGGLSRSRHEVTSVGGITPSGRGHGNPSLGRLSAPLFDPIADLKYLRAAELPRSPDHASKTGPTSASRGPTDGTHSRSGEAEDVGVQDGLITDGENTHAESVVRRRTTYAD